MRSSTARAIVGARLARPCSLGGSRRRPFLSACWRPGRAPLRKAVFQPAHLATASAKRRQRLVGKKAVRTAAVGHDLLRVIELREASFKLAQGNVHCTGQMSKRKFVRRPDIEDG